MSSKYEKVKKYYDDVLWNESRVHDAVTADPPWITEDEYQKITGLIYESAS